MEAIHLVTLATVLIIHAGHIPTVAGDLDMTSGSSGGSNSPLPQQPSQSPSQALQCVDSDSKCSLWASQGECQSNAVWMMSNCRRSCQSCQGGDRAWQLRNQLSKNYEAGNSSTAAISRGAFSRLVRIESVRLAHLEVDEQRQMVRAFGKMVLSWNDSKVVWDKNEWGISWLNFYWIQVWTPQLVQTNAPPNQPGLVSGKVLAANYTGRVFMWTDFNFVAPYQFDYSSYPRDEQLVCFKFDDKRYFSVRFVVADEVKNQRREAITDTHLAGWTVKEMKLSDSKYVVKMLSDWRLNPFDVQTHNCELCVKLRRNAVYYMTEMFCPALVTSALTLCSVLFQLSNMQVLCIAFSLLLQLLSMVVLNSRLPAYTNVAPAILKFAGFNLCASATLLIASLGLRQLSHANGNIPLPRSIYAALTLADRFIPLPKGGKNADEESSLGYYSDVAYTLNNLTFMLALLVYLILMATCLVF